MKKKRINVYLAGKIEPNDWRNLFFDMRRDESLNLYGVCSPEELANLEFPCKIEVPNYVLFVKGPFFLWCDHRCCHGDNTHGVGVFSDVCDGSDHKHVFTPHRVTEVCKKQIEDSDVVFAYIDDPTCYGTLFELGYARALGKKIVLFFRTWSLWENMWFIHENADEVYISEGATLTSAFKGGINNIFNNNQNN